MVHLIYFQQNFPVDIEIHQLTHKHKEKFDNTKSLIRSHKSKKDRQYNGQKGETIQRPKRRDNTTTIYILNGCHAEDTDINTI
jgi:hypothetical protein